MKPERLLPPCSLQPTGKMLSDSRLVQPLVYMERLDLIRNVCRDEALKSLSHTAVSKFVLDRIFVCDKHKILFCQTPKVGNTQWKKVLIVLNGACCSAVPSSVGLGPGGSLGASPERAGDLTESSLVFLSVLSFKSWFIQILPVFKGPPRRPGSPYFSLQGPHLRQPAHPAESSFRFMALLLTSHRRCPCKSRVQAH